MAGKVVLVTGGGRGIGAASARMLAAQGWRVVINFRNDQGAAEATASTIQAAGGEAITIQADTGDPAAVQTMFETLDRTWGRLDALVNNAGIVGPRGSFSNVSLQDMEDVLKVNVIGYMMCIQAAIPRMLKVGGGAIVNVSSGAATQGGGGENVLYAVSKGAVNSLGIGLGVELARIGIRVNTVSPGLTRTDMPPLEKLESQGPGIPMGRVGEPEEVAAGIVWFLSEQASWTAGANLRISGGRP